MSGNTAADNEPAVVERKRRPERWADDEQPRAVESSVRAASQKWKADVLNATLPGGGNNKGRKKATFKSFFAPTQEQAEALRNKALDDWLHSPVRGARKTAGSETEGASGSGSATVDESRVDNDAKRPKRAVAPSASALKEPTIVDSRPHHPTAGTGCVANPHRGQPLARPMLLPQRAHRGARAARRPRDRPPNHRVHHLIHSACRVPTA